MSRFPTRLERSSRPFLRGGSALLALAALAAPSQAEPPPPAPAAGGPANTDDAPAVAPPPRVDLSALERAYHAERDDRRRARVAADMAGLPGSAELLTHIVETDPSDDVALAATYALRRATLGGLVHALERRLDTG